VEECAVIDAATGAGARQLFLVEEPVAAAMGAGLNISEANGKMVVDIGGGTTDIAVLSLDEVVVSESIKIAGDKFDEAIMRYTRTKYNILVGESTAEQIKCQVGAVYGHGKELVGEYNGRNVKTGLPDKVRLSSREMLEALMEPITAVIDAICSVIARTPPELVGDIMDNGIVMTGGGSLLRGLDKMISEITKIPVRVADNPLDCVAIGTGLRLENLEYYKDGAINLSRERDKRK
jgi:rod shape-determining protein MreB